MKKITYYLALVLISFFFLGGKDNESGQEGPKIRFIKVKDEKSVNDKQMKNLNNGYKRIKNREVRIFYYKGDSTNTRYHINYFHNYSGKMDSYGAIVSSTFLFNSASANWINDTTLTIMMKCTQSGDTSSYTLFGNSHFINERITKRSGMIISR